MALDTSVATPPSVADRADLFLPAEQDAYVVALVDASHSTTVYNIDFAIGSAEGQYRKVFNGLLDILLHQYPNAKEFRLLWWNGGSHVDGPWKTGTYINPAVLKSKQMLKMAWKKFPQQEINPRCITEPWRAFEQLLEQSDWLDIKTHSSVTIAYLTDGELGYYQCPQSYLNDLKTRLRTSITRVLDHHPGIVLDILTLEPHARDLQKVESLSNAVGCDVWKTLGSLLSRVRLFKCWNPKHPGEGFVQRFNPQLRPGEIPYDTHKFSHSHVGAFLHWLKTKEIASKKHDDGALFDVIFQLSTTIGTLFLNKPTSLRDRFCRRVASFFNKSAILENDAFDLLMAGVAQEMQDADKSLLNTEKRTQLKATYAEADSRIQRDTRSALGIAFRGMYTTFPVGGKIFQGTGIPSDGFQSLQLTANFSSRECAICLDGVALPILPAIASNFAPMEKQCLRQWLRYLVSRERKAPAASDLALLWILVRGLAIGLSCSPVAALWRDFSAIMLEKNCKNVANRTLEQSLRAGDFPDIGDNYEGIRTQLSTVSQQLFTDPAPRPFSLWYAICLNIDPKLAIAQYAHCSQDLLLDLPNFAQLAENEFLQMLTAKLRPEFRVTYVTIEEPLEYVCPYSNRSTRENGGLRILPHQTDDGVQCVCTNVVDVQEYARVRDQQIPLLCPLCYETLTPSHFQETLPAQSNLCSTHFDDNTPNPFAGTAIANTASPLKMGVALKIGGGMGLTGQGIVIRMQGVVGAGKTTFAKLIQAEIEKRGGVCVIASTDEHFRKTGWLITDQNAWDKVCARIAEDLLAVESPENRDKALRACILDTCGGDPDERSVFDVPLGNGWKQIKFWPNIPCDDPAHMSPQTKSDYLAWALWNVLSRTQIPGPDLEQRLPLGQVPYTFCPRHGNGLPQALKVLQKKATAHKLTNVKGGGRMPTLPKGTSLDQAITILQPKRDAYQSNLSDPNVVVKTLVDRFIQ